MKLKLVSPKDTLLGHVDVPDHWKETLERWGSMRILMMSRVALLPFQSEPTTVTPDVRTLMLVEAPWSQFSQAVRLAAGTIEELEAQPGCSFTPSAAYLRSLVE